MPKARLYEITALLNYSVVVLANSREQALAAVETWEHAWHTNADFVGVSDIEILDIRDGGIEDAHEDARGLKIIPERKPANAND